MYGRDEQNLGSTREDDAGLVAENRRQFLQQLTGGAAVSLCTVRQVHGAVVRVALPTAGGHAQAGSAAPLQGDGLVSQGAGQFLGILTADCVPILLADTQTRAVAALHAGWRGTLACIVERGVEAMRATFGSRAEHLRAAIGPAIRPCCFEVGDEVKSAFAEAFPYAEALFAGQGDSRGEARPRLDLHTANQRQLLEAGLAADNIEIVPECTACSRLLDGRRKYFSYRAEGGVTGRMMAVIGTV